MNTHMMPAKNKARNLSKDVKAQYENAASETFDEEDVLSDYAYSYAYAYEYTDTNSE